MTDADNAIDAGSNLAATTVITDGSTVDNDTLKATITAAANAILTNIETLNITSFAGSMNLATVTNNKIINVDGVGATFTNLIDNESFAITNNFAGTLGLGAAADGQTIKLATTNANATIELDTVGGGNTDEILEITNSGASTLTVSGDANAGGTVLRDAIVLRVLARSISVRLTPKSSALTEPVVQLASPLRQVLLVEPAFTVVRVLMC